MMSKTHITVDIAASLAICAPMTADTVLAALAGGAAGGIICDIDCSHRRSWKSECDFCKRAVGRKLDC